jgi:hypothetical protein
MGGVCGLYACGLASGPMADFCEHSNESLHSIKGGEFLDYLNDYELLMDSAT